MPQSSNGFSDYRALSEFRYQIRLFLSFSERAAREHGIEPQQHQMLLACKGLPEGSRPTIGTLAQRMCIEHHSAVTLVDKLEANRWVQRTPSPVDRREVLVQITPRGETLLASLSEIHSDQLAKVGPRLIEALSDILDAKAEPRRERA